MSERELVRLFPVRELSKIVDDEEKTWVCVEGASGLCEGEMPFIYRGCGTILPGQTGRRIYRRKCDCELRAFERYNDHWKPYQQQRACLMATTYAWTDRNSDLPLAERTFEQYVTKYDSTDLRKAYNLVRAFADYRKGNLILYGPYGVGKTHLLAAMLNYIRDVLMLPCKTRFISAMWLFDCIQEIQQEKESRYDFMEKLIKAEVLVIDDVDKVAATIHRESIYREIIDARVLAKKPTCISLNGENLDKLSECMGGSVASRLKVGRVEVKMIGQDYRDKLK